MYASALVPPDFAVPAGFRDEDFAARMLTVRDLIARLRCGDEQRARPGRADPQLDGYDGPWVMGGPMDVSFK